MTTPRKRDKNGQFRGGARPGAGRPRSATTLPHVERPEINPEQPQHVTLRVLERAGNLRRPDMYGAILVALGGVAAMDAFRVVHYSVQDDHVHLLCEAESKRALRSGITSFAISAARRINKVLTQRRGKKESGRVFADRYQVESIESIAQTRSALAHVLNNWRRHGHDKRERGIFGNRLDPYSSAMLFGGWKERIDPQLDLPLEVPVPVVSRPLSWLLREGYRHAPALSVYDVPKPAPASATRSG